MVRWTMNEVVFSIQHWDFPTSHVCVPESTCISWSELFECLGTTIFCYLQSASVFWFQDYWCLYWSHWLLWRLSFNDRLYLLCNSIKQNWNVNSTRNLFPKKKTRNYRYCITLCNCQTYYPVDSLNTKMGIDPQNTRLTEWKLYAQSICSVSFQCTILLLQPVENFNNFLYAIP